MTLDALRIPWSRPADAPTRLEPAARAFVAVALALVAIGIVAVYSASATTSEVALGDATYYLRRQALWAGLGVVTMFLAMRTDPRRLDRIAGPLLVLALVALAVLLVPGVAPRIKGAQRWVRIGSVSFQPSELAKLALVLWLAAHLARNAARLGEWRRGTLPAVVPLGLAAFLVLVEPDFGTALFLGAVGVAMTLVGGVPVRRLLLLAVYALPVVAWQIERRWEVFAKRLEAVGGGAGDGPAAYQVQQSLVALGSGGWFGRGLGAGRQKLFFLPEARTDFILPVFAEETGFVGAALVVLLFALLVACGARVALGAARHDRFGFLLAFGLVFWIGLQAAGNVAVVTATVPTKGIALPFVSLGGSSLLVLCAATGLVYAVARHVDARTAAEARARPAEPGPSAGVPVALGGAA